MAGGFVYVYGGYMLENPLGVILSDHETAEMEAEGSLDRRQNDSLYTYSWEVKVLDVFSDRRARKIKELLGQGVAGGFPRFRAVRRASSPATRAYLRCIFSTAVVNFCG